jgi:hypothetical protein
MSALPQPPAPQAAPPQFVHGGLAEPIAVPGQLTTAWRAVFVVGWGCVVLAFAAVWRSARTLGLSTWWLGASSAPQFFLVQVLPFVPAIILVGAGTRNVRYLPYFGMMGAIVLAAIATGDLGRFDRLAAAEFSIAGAALLLSLATFAGVLRPAARAEPTGDGPD